MSSRGTRQAGAERSHRSDVLESAGGATKGSGQYPDALATYKDLKDKNDELNNLNTIRNTALIAAVVVYAYNVVDSIFFSSSTVESPKADIENKSVIVRSAMIDRTPGILLSKSF